MSRRIGRADFVGTARARGTQITQRAARLLIMSQPELPKRVVRTLAAFTLAMLALPLLAFFGLRHAGFNALVCGGTAAAIANAVVIAYVVVAVLEKDDPVAVAQREKKKLQ